MNACDALLGFYLLSVSVRDSIAGSEYISKDLQWRSSVFCWLLSGISLFSVLLSCFLLLLLSFFRYLVVEYPLSHGINKTKIGFVVSICSLLAATLVVLSILGRVYQRKDIFVQTSLCFHFSDVNDCLSQKILSGIFSGMMLVSLSVVLAFYSKIVKRVKQSAMEVMMDIGAKATQQLSVNLALVCITNTLCWLPTSILLLHITFYHKVSNYAAICDHTYHFAHKSFD